MYDNADRERIQIAGVIATVVDCRIGNAQFAVQLSGFGGFRVNTGI